MNHQVQQTRAFAYWLLNLRDMRARIAIARRIDRLAASNFGDFKSVGDCVSELRIDIGTGYRVYFTLRDVSIVILLAGGDKSTQPADIRQAKKMVKEI